MEHPEGDVVFRHACKLRAKGIVLEAAWIVLPVRPLARLAQFKNSAAPAVKAKDRGR